MIVRRQNAPMTEAELVSTVEAGQSDRIAFVGSKTSARALAETLAAMANADGGVVLMGVSARGVLEKEADPAALWALVTAACLMCDPPLVLPAPHAVETARGTALVVQTPAGLPHIYSVHGLYLTRTLAQNRALTTAELRQLLLERGDTGYEAQIMAGATLADLDQPRIMRYLDQVSFAATENLHDALLARGCVTYAGREGASTRHLLPTVAGILLFGRNPQQFLRSAEIICVRYAGEAMSDEFVRQDLGGTLGDQIRQAEAFVMTNMRRGMRISGILREDSTEYPMGVVREAIVNAVAHREYSVRGEGIRLFMYNNRLEIYSPGRLPGHVTLDNLKDERYSRNEAIVAVLSDMGYIERLGYGIDRMLAAMKTHGLPEPLFEETTAGFKVTLRSAAADLAGASTARRVPSGDPLNERQLQAIQHIREQGRITNSDFQALVPDVSAETIRRDLADLVERNILLRIGEKRATYYILK